MENLQDRPPAKILPGKKAKTYAELIALIRSKGFIVDDERECVALLRKVNYTRLAEYFRPFLPSDCTNGANLSNIHFSRIRRIYEFDRKINAVLFESIGEIERYLRAQFAYFSGHRHGAFGYLEEGTFSDKHNHENFSERLKECIKENKKALASQHHEERDGENFPIWDLIEFFSMGMLSYFYGDLKIKDQKALAREMYGAGTLPLRLVSWLRCLTNLRNRCAHYARLYYWIFPALPTIPEKTAFTSDRKLFTQIMILKLLYPDPEKWNSLAIAKIETLLMEYREDICLEHIGFPENWKEILQHTERA